MAKKLYIGNLPYEMSDERLNEVFSEMGEVESANVIKDKFSGRSRGFGFVEMADDEGASKAMAELNEKEIDGRKLIVSEAKPMAPRENNRGNF